MYVEQYFWRIVFIICIISMDNQYYYIFKKNKS
ncbi:unnamed protein product, partial [Vitis vinifera]|uniref:Uncharacterized protein n=1 Tax=Vitis vinifera TaxID=29760 RepID=D7SJZ9_VITVI